MIARLMKKIVFFMLFALVLISCGESDPIINDIRSQGKLVVLTLNSPTTYYLGADDSLAGYEYDLSKALADSLNVEVEYKLFDNLEGLLKAIVNDEGHIAAAGLTQTDEREELYLFGPNYKSVQQQVICHRKSRLPKDVSDLLMRSILIIADSSYQETLLELQKEHPELKWESTNELSAEQVLQKVENKEVDCTVIDSNVFTLNRRYYPQLTDAFPISEEQNLAWVLPPNAGYFKQYVDDWFVQTEKNSLLSIINERYYGYADIFDFYNNHVFLKRIKTRLPKYESDFRQVAEQYQIPWTLLAAQSYQESGWNAKARSHTGVRFFISAYARSPC